MSKLSTQELIDSLAHDLEQARVQLARCSAAASGATKQPARPGQYGWSLAYQDVLDLRIKYDRLLAQSRKAAHAAHGCSGGNKKPEKGL